MHSFWPYPSFQMKVGLSLSVVLFASNCLAADNSSSHEPNSNPNSSLGRLPFENKTDMPNDELKFYVDFDVYKYTTELESRYISIEKASQLSTCSLTKLENNSAKCLQNFMCPTIYCEEYIHKANKALAKLLKQNKQTTLQHSAFESWKNSGFAASQFIGLVNECVQKHSDKDWRHHVKFLAKKAMNWHYYTNLYYKEVKVDEHTSNYHLAQYIAINFIYRTKVRLNSSDNAELERCISIESPNGIRQLARKIVASNEYSKEDLGYILLCTSSYDAGSIYADKITLMAFLLCEEIGLAWSENDLMNSQYQLQGPGVAFDVETALYCSDVNGIIKAYDQCISKTAADVSVNKKCSEALQYLWQISLHKHKLEVLTDRFNVSTSYQQTSQHENVVEPAFLLLNSYSYLQKYDNREFMERLQNHHFHSYEDALKGKRKLRQVDGELYNRLLMIEKCRDYVQHKDDIAYIRNDFAKLERKVQGG